jgi:isopentenyl phosphate kinase
MTQTKLIFLKLGGSLITDKTKPLTPRPEVLQRIAAEIARAIHKNPRLRLVIGHGSGSFGHAVANQYQTQSGGNDRDYWHGFAEVWLAARELNQIVIQHLKEAGLQAISFPPSAGVVADNKALESWDIRPIDLALSHGLIPVVQGDVIFDRTLGGTIFSTEQIFQYLAKQFHPAEILLAGRDRGVYHNQGQPRDIIHKITPANIKEILPGITGSEAVDVTGGMLAKVQLMLSLLQDDPSLEVQVFSGEEKGNILRALSGHVLGTLITH